MLKRIFWLALLAFGGWLLWNLWRQRQGADHAAIPQFAPIAPAAPPTPSTAPAAASAPPADAAPMPVPPAEPAVPAAHPDMNDAGAPTSTQVVTGAGTAAAPISTDSSSTVIGYCTRCREKRPIRDAHEEITENGRRAARGTCPVCGGNMYTFLKKEARSETRP
jgi:hypothetical protein